jgi:adenylosuccinate lyase
VGIWFQRTGRSDENREHSEIGTGYFRKAAAKPEKFEKPEKPEKLEIEVAGPKGFEPGPDPTQIDPRIDQLVRAVSALAQQVEQIAKDVEQLKPKIGR